ncbi:MAG: fatty acid desaturase [Thermoleophilia bacterium]
MTDTPVAWRRVLAPYTQPQLHRSVVDLATSIVPYLLLLVAIGVAYRVSVALALVLSIPAAGFLVRSFIVFHDCAHGSFFRSRRANELVGIVAGLLVWMPFARWRHEHAIHHATAGDLDRRGVGDVWTLTVAEYNAMGPLGRLGYRAFRNPLVLFGLGWILVLGLKPRVIKPSAPRRIVRAVLLTNVALGLIAAGLVLWLGWGTALVLQAPVMVTGIVGIWLFYVQHQFEDTYWADHESWGFDEAALRGSSYLKLPRVLQFFTGNIGFHHVHHLAPRIPNYNLEAAHVANPALQETPVVTIREGLKASRLKLWDEERNRLVTFADARAARAAHAAAARAAAPPARA